MRTKNLKPKAIFNFFLILVFGFLFINLSIAQELKEKSKAPPIAKEIKEGTRIVISTSGPTKFSSYWADTPPRLIVEFQTENIVDKLDNEVIVNKGVIKKITSRYFEDGQRKFLKSLTFELTQKAFYRIWQEADNIILDIETTAEASGIPEVAATHPALDHPKILAELPKKERKNKIGLIFWFVGLAFISGLGFLLFWLFWRRDELNLDKNVAAQEIEKLKSQVAEKNKLLEQEKLIRKAIEDISLKREKEFDQLKLELQKEAKLLEKEELLKKEKETEQVKNSYESIKEVLVNKGLAEKIGSFEFQVDEFREGQANQLIKVIESTTGFKVPDGIDVTARLNGLIKNPNFEKKLLEMGEKGELSPGALAIIRPILALGGKRQLSPEKIRSILEVNYPQETPKRQKISSPEGGVELWIPEKSTDKRHLFRLDLTKDYNRTIILRIESPDKSKSIKSFANNIGLGGLCFETRRDFKEKETINLRLFFFGDNVPILKIKAEINWKKTDSPANHYGVSFVSLEDKTKTELSRYIESNIARG